MGVGAVDERFQTNRPFEEQQETSNRGAAVAMLALLLALPLAIFFKFKPESAHAAMDKISRAMHFDGNPLRALASKSAGKASRGANVSPQQVEAETLLEQAIRHQEGAAEQIANRRDGWRGRLKLDERMTGLLDAALNSDDLRVRGAGVELELTVYNLPDTPASAEMLFRRAANEPKARPWALWMIGAIGGRGVETDRAFQTLILYTHDPDEKTRYWASTGLTLLGTDASVPALLEILRQDSSIQVRQSAARGLAQAGMLTKEQRRKAVPALVKYAEDPSLDARTKSWVYQALREITGANVASDPQAWRDWWSQNGRQ